MAKTPMRSLRMDDATWEAIRATVARLNDNDRQRGEREPYTVSEWIRTACVREMRKMDRSRRRK